MEDEEVAESWEEAADSGVRNVATYPAKRCYNPILAVKQADTICDTLDVCGACVHKDLFF